MSGKEKIIEEGYTNSLWNALAPFSGGKAIMGSALFVAFETIVGQVLRKLYGAPTNIRDSIETHTYSIPLLGPLNFGDPYRDLPVGKDEKPDAAKEAMDGAKQIPAAIGGYIAHKMRQDGIKIPSFMNKDVAILMVGKVVSRVLKAYINSSLPKDVQAGEAVLNALVNRATRLSKDEAEVRMKSARRGDADKV